MESQPQNSEFRNNPENFQPYNYHVGLEARFLVWIFYYLQGSRQERVIKHYLPGFSNKTYVFGTQKNRLNEMVL